MTKEHERLTIGQTDTSVHIMSWKTDEPPLGTVVFSHGFTVSGYESRRMFLDVAEEVVRVGYDVLLFDYRGSGYSDLKFSEMTLDTSLEDLDVVLDHAAEINRGSRLIVWGQSLGSGLSSLKLAERTDVDGAIFWCLSADLYDRYMERFGKELLEKGEVYLPKGFLVKPPFLESAKGKDVIAAYSQLTIPKLLVHGDNDPVADFTLSERAIAGGQDPQELVRIEGGNHGFKNQPEQFSKAVSRSLAWLTKNFGKD